MTGASELRVGFVGLGRLGSQLVDGLLAADHASLTVHDVNPEAMARYAATSAVLAPDVATVATGSHVVGVCVQDDDQLREVVVGPGGLLAAPMTDGAMIVVHSTVHPDTCRDLARHAAELDVTLIDAAISNGGRMPGGVPTRVVLVGSDEVTLARCQPYLASFGDLIEHVGQLGSGEIAKLLNNLLMVVNMGMATEVVRCGEDLGVARDVLVRALATGSGSSQGIRTWLAAERAAHNMVLLGKDVRLALDVLDHGTDNVAVLRSGAERGLAALAAQAERHAQVPDG